MVNLENILSSLTDAGPQGAFCARQSISSEDLQIKIKGLPTVEGKLKWPVSARAAKSLISLSEPAKFGWKDQTLLDPRIRDVWEVPKSRVQIDNRAWNKALNPMLEQFKTQLGLAADARLKAQLHSMLVYEPGQFFKPHQDSEKVDDMVASLVVVLPSSYRGGVLVINHQEEKKRFQAPRETDDKLQLIAFYADCHHEVTPVTEGYRITLTYNLVLESAGQTSSPASNPAALDALTNGLRDYFQVAATSAAGKASDKIPRPKKWVYLLDHQYTQKSLHWQRLKRADRPRADALCAAADALGLERYLALAEIQEIWSAEEQYSRWGYGYRRNRDWCDPYFDDEEEAQEPAGSSDNYILQDLIDSDIRVQHLIDADNIKAAIDGLSLPGPEIHYSRPTDQFDPFKTEYEGYMGNYGNTLERWYHRTAILLWRKQDHYAVLCELDPKRVAKELLQLAKNKKTLSQAQVIVNSILPYWAWYAEKRNDSKLFASAYKLALQIQCAESAQGLLLPLGLESLTPARAPAFAALEQAYGTDWGVSLLESWLKAERYSFQREPVAQLSRVVRALLDKSKGQCGLLKWLLDYQYTTLKNDFDFLQKNSSRMQVKSGESSRTAQTIDLLLAACLAEEKAIHQQVLDYVVGKPLLFNVAALTEILLSLHKMQAWGYGQLLNHTMTLLEQRIARGYRVEDDWSIRTKLGCGCQDCKKLKLFLSSSTVKTLLWPLNQGRRSHIHGVIEGLGIPVTHKTKRQGSPHKLVLTKTKQLFLQDQQELKQAQAMLKKLRVLI